MAHPLAVASSILVGAVAIAAWLVLSLLDGCALEFGPAGAPRPVPILLVTAHPDDEAMFFAPSLLALSRGVCCRVFILCLSTGEQSIIGVLLRNRKLLESRKVGCSIAFPIGTHRLRVIPDAFQLLVVVV